MITIERYRRRHARRIRTAALTGLGVALLYGGDSAAPGPIYHPTSAFRAGSAVTPVSAAKLATLREPVRVSRALVRRPVKHRTTAPAARFAGESSGGSIPAVWARVAACESGGNWRTNTGNGYYGGVQEDLTFWRDYGGLAFAARPDLASPSQQIVVARRGLAAQGPSAWPVCSIRAGLRRGD